MMWYVLALPRQRSVRGHIFFCTLSYWGGHQAPRVYCPVVSRCLCFLSTSAAVLPGLPQCSLADTWSVSLGEVGGF